MGPFVHHFGFDKPFGQPWHEDPQVDGCRREGLKTDEPRTFERQVVALTAHAAQTLVAVDDGYHRGAEVEAFVAPALGARFDCRGAGSRLQGRTHGWPIVVEFASPTDAGDGSVRAL